MMVAILSESVHWMVMYEFKGRHGTKFRRPEHVALGLWAAETIPFDGLR